MNDAIERLVDAWIIQHYFTGNKQPCRVFNWRRLGELVGVPGSEFGFQFSD